MDYVTFEARVMELLFKTDVRLTSQLAAFRVGCSVETARKHLDTMTEKDIVTMEVDDSGVTYYDVAGRPPPTNEPLSWVPSPSQALVKQISQPLVVHNVLVPARPEKSVLAAVLLSWFFGPLGMLYSTPLGALCMLLLNVILAIPTLFTVLFVTIPAGMIWAGMAAHKNNELRREELRALAAPLAVPRLPEHLVR